MLPGRRRTPALATGAPTMMKQEALLVNGMIILHIYRPSPNRLTTP